MSTATLIFDIIVVVLTLTGTLVVKGEEPPMEPATTGTQSYPHYYIYQPEEMKFSEGTIKLPEYAKSLMPTFLTDPPSEIFHSCSQSSMQDLVVLTIFKDKDNGYFVDLAANEWKMGSNTYTLEYFNKWKGICIEPNPQYLEGLLSNRKCKIFTNPVSAHGNETVTFRFTPNGDKRMGGLGGIVGDGYDNKGSNDADVTLVTTTLTSILDHAEAPPVMDYLSLDVEGAEYYALQGLDTNKYTFRLITIERPKINSHLFLSLHNYRFVYLMSGFGECLYMHRSMENYTDIMQSYQKPGAGTPAWHGEERAYLLSPAWNETMVQNTSIPYLRAHHHHNQQHQQHQQHRHTAHKQQLQDRIDGELQGHFDTPSKIGRYKGTGTNVMRAVRNGNGDLGSS
mmetsp:Transcript_279/g.510  ORF Transcript_279/g.510 Transcript_279/m.510 type:complete len:396 (+) Transcript_279:45-1232(+)